MSPGTIICHQLVQEGTYGRFYNGVLRHPLGEIRDVLIKTVVGMQKRPRRLIYRLIPSFVFLRWCLADPSRLSAVGGISVLRHFASEHPVSSGGVHGSVGPATSRLSAAWQRQLEIVSKTLLSVEFIAKVSVQLLEFIEQTQTTFYSKLNSQILAKQQRNVANVWFTAEHSTISRIRSADRPRRVASAFGRSPAQGHCHQKLCVSGFYRILSALSLLNLCCLQFGH